MSDERGIEGLEPGDWRQQEDDERQQEETLNEWLERSRETHGAMMKAVRASMKFWRELTWL